MKSFAILGLGRFGKELALQLARSGAEVLAVDKNQELVNEIADEVTRAASADIQDKEALQDLGVADCDVVILSVGGNLAVSVLTVMNLKSLGVRHLVCKAYDELHREVLLKLGADQVLIPEKEMAVKLAPQLINPRMRDSIQLSDAFGIEEMEAPSSWIGKSIGEMHVRNQFEVNIIAIKNGGNVNPSPRPKDVITADDVLLISGSKSALGRLRKMK